MSRGIGEFEPIQDQIPEWLAVIIALITQLGDGWFLISLLAILYWTRSNDHEDILLVGGMLACGIGLYRGLKFLFGFGRPEQPLLDPELLPAVIRQIYEATAFASGYGFPSGHATMTTIVYFGLAAVLTRGSKRLRFGIAALIVSLVGFSRVALGVHYVVDIVAGVALGGILLVVAFDVLDRLPTYRLTILLIVAVVLNVFYVLTSNGHFDAIIMIGISLGLLGGWQIVVLARELVTATSVRDGGPAVGLRLGLAIVSLAPLAFVIEGNAIPTREPVVLAAYAGIGVGIVIIVPVARHSRHVQRFGAGLRFWFRALTGWIRSGFDTVRSAIASLR